MSLTKDLLGSLAVPQTDFMLDYDPHDPSDKESFLLDDDYGEHRSTECRMCNIVINTID